MSSMKKEKEPAERKKPLSDLDKRRCERLLRKYNERRVEEPTLTQDELASFCGMASSSVSRMMTGSLAISASAAILLARRLFCHPGDFHDDFVDFTAAESVQNLTTFQQIERLPDEDLETVRRLVSSLASKNKVD